MQKDLYQIGEISKICEISIQALRHYDRIELLSPAYTDPDTGYRYYSHQQILNIKIIQQFKKLNFSLNEIKDFVKRNNLQQTLDLLMEKELKTTEELKRISDNLRQLKKLKTTLKYYFSNEFDEKIQHIFMEEKKVLFRRYKSPFIPEIFITRFTELHNLAEKFHFKTKGDYMAIFHDHYTVFDPKNADIEVCIEVDPPVERSDFIRSIESGDYVTKIHLGVYSKIPESYGKMLEWMSENGFELSGSAIESYIIDYFLTENQEEFVTKLQLPVSRIKNI